MKALSVVQRELRVASRRPGTYWRRLVVVLVAVIITAWMMLFLENFAPANLGKSLFSAMATLAFLHGLFAGLSHTSDCISEEKRDGTLGLLFLTDLRGYDVVLGKLVAASLGAFYGLLAVFPVMAIPLALGGLGAGNFWRMVLVLVNTLLQSLAVGVLMSTLARDSRRAASMTGVALMAINGFMPLVGVWTASRHNVNPQEPYFWPSAGFAFFMALELPVTGLRLTGFWISSGITASVSVLSLALASWITPRVWQDRSSEGWLPRLRQRLQQWSYGAPPERRAFRRRLLEVNPMFWLAGRDRLRPAYVWIFLGACLAVWIWGGVRFGRDWVNPGTYVATAVLLNAALKIWIASASCERFLEDRRENALELLLSTPLTVRELLQGQILALRRQFQWPLLSVVGVNWLFMLAPWWHEGWGESTGVWVRVFLALIVTLVADAWALAWVGMWTGLTVKHANRAAAAAVSRVMVLPWLAFVGILMITFLFASLSRLQGGGFEPDENFLLGLGMVLSVAAEAGFGWWAWNHLQNDLRAVAAQRYQPAAESFLRQIFRWS